MKNRKVIIGAIVLCLVIVLSVGTYAYWVVTKSQEGTNKILGGCLKITMADASSGITLDKTWPIDNFEGMQLEGYTFKVTNECDKPQDYRIDLDRLTEETGQTAMSNEYLATLLDYGVPTVYSELSREQTTENGVKEKRVLGYDTVMGKSTNTHTLRLWIDKSSPVTEQGTSFISQVKINAGQGIEKYYTPAECFTFDAATGSITAYDATCGGTDVVIPYEIGGVAVTQIGNLSFKEKGLTSVEFPKSVTTLGTGSFQSNPNLEKIIFRDGLVSIGTNSFSASTSSSTLGKLSFVSFPKTITTINGAAFRYNSLEQVVIPDSVTGNLPSVFFGNMIKKFKLGSNVDWSKCSNLFTLNEIEEVIVPDNVTVIGSSMFRNNPIKTIKFGSGVNTIKTSAFENSVEGKYKNENYLTEVFIPSNITNIEISAFGTAPSDVIIRTERTKEDFLANVATGTTPGYLWYGNAKVISSDGLLIYE